ncbi:hypothetical protein D8S78_02425 [Natrialba swarupiae]|nr:hypothetical protein [Natrialba swarupiae]
MGRVRRSDQSRTDRIPVLLSTADGDRRRSAGTVRGLDRVLTLVVAANSIIGWLYLGKPDLREVFTQPKPAETTEDH